MTPCVADEPPHQTAAGRLFALRGAKPADKAFLEMKSHHHHMAVVMASMALPSAQRDELAKLQQKIIEDQAKEIAQMRTWRRAWYPG